MNFPFIVEFVRSYKDAQNIYFLLEYVRGLELFDVIRDIGLLSTSESKFYTGSIFLALEYLHLQNIVYRDLKPENIMVDQSGYIRLIDMGTCKLLHQSNTGSVSRTFTIIGTPLYMAPEVISGKGYTYPVDLWSIGVCLYEFMCGLVPFGQDSEDPYEIYEEILTQPVRYPLYLQDKKAKLLMEQLLSKTPEKRLNGSFAALKSHPWFDDFDWDKLMEKELKAAYVPKEHLMISQEFIDQARKQRCTAMEEITICTPTYTKKSSSWDVLSPDLEWDKGF